MPLAWLLGYSRPWTELPPSSLARNVNFRCILPVFWSHRSVTYRETSTNYRQPFGSFFRCSSATSPTTLSNYWRSLKPHNGMDQLGDEANIRQHIGTRE